jgi:hypothetical protein
MIWKERGREKGARGKGVGGVGGGGGENEGEGNRKVGGRVRKRRREEKGDR